MGVILYHFPLSSPSRNALLSIKALQIDVEVKIVDMYKGEHLTPEFIELNPQHTIPTLVDGDLVLWDSHAIVSYLATTYAKDKSLYPQTNREKALVDSRLYFDCGTLYPRIYKILIPVLYLGENSYSDEKRKSLNEALGFLNTFLENDDFVAGANFTIADACLVASISTIVAAGWDITEFKNITKWLPRCIAKIPDYENANQIPANEYGNMFKKNLKMEC